MTEGSIPESVDPGGPTNWPPLTYWMRVAAVVVAVIAVARAVGMLGNVILIFVAAYVISLGLQPLLTNLERRGLRRGAGMAVVILVGCSWPPASAR